jgi:dTDP-glucose pyrophosphorylase
MIIETDLEPLVIQMEESIRNALARMNASPHLIQIVVDEDNRVQGMVTDGDVRRALVSGATLDDPVKNCMQENLITATNVETAIATLPDMGGRRPCVPVVDTENRLTHLVSKSSQTPGLTTALIMAGGFGKRLGEQTKSKPKPLIEVGGRPILWHIIKDLEEHGVTQIFIAVHYLADQILDFVNSAGFNVRINLLPEKSPLGTAGALGLIPPDVDGPILVMNGDIVTRADYAAMMTHHRMNQRDATIGAARYDQEVPFGVLDIDANGDVIEIREKPRYEHFVSAGIYILQPKIYKSVDLNTQIDMPELLRKSIDKNHRVGLFPIYEYWLDLGRPNDLALAEAESSRWLES